MEFDQTQVIYDNDKEQEEEDKKDNTNTRKKEVILKHSSF